jgi:hypothetical protein
MPQGCFFRVLFYGAIAFVSMVVLFLYINRPKDVEWVEQPIDLAPYFKDLTFPDKPTPELVLDQPAKNLLYQAVFQEEIADFTIIYKAVFKMDRSVQLDKPLPVKDSEKNTLNERIAFNNIVDEFKPQLKLAKDARVPSTRQLKIYEPQSKIVMKLRKGSYSTYHYEVDKVGYVREVMIFDQEAKVLYYERERYHAFDGPMR